MNTPSIFGSSGKARSNAEVEQGLPHLHFTKSKNFVIIIIENKKETIFIFVFPLCD